MCQNNHLVLHPYKNASVNYGEDSNRILSGRAFEVIFWWLAQFFQASIHFHSCHQQQQTKENSFALNSSKCWRWACGQSSYRSIGTDNATRTSLNKSTFRATFYILSAPLSANSVRSQTSGLYGGSEQRRWIICGVCHCTSLQGEAKGCLRVDSFIFMEIDKANTRNQFKTGSELELVSWQLSSNNDWITGNRHKMCALYKISKCPQRSNANALKICI